MDRQKQPSWCALLLFTQMLLAVVALATPAQAQSGVMTMPTPGSTLTGSSVTFQWNAGSGVSGYWLDVGTAEYGNTIFQSSVSSTSQLVTGLPTNGSPVYATLYTIFTDGTKVYNEYTYTAFNAQAAAAVMTYPTSPSTLSASSVTFQWSTVSKATYWLDVGTAKYGNTIFQSSVSSTSQPVTGLPTNGSPVYATLYTIFTDGTKVYNEYTYTAFNAGSVVPAVMQSPTQGSTLPANSVTFTWSAGTNATAYWLDVGNVAGGNQWYQSGSITSQSATVPNVPPNGLPVYVTLYSLGAEGQKLSNSYTYTAANGAQMVSPAPGSTLSGGSATFTWSAGGATAYQLTVGSTYGGSDIYSSTSLTALTTTATPLPQNGSTLYVTLYSEINGIWVQNYYSYVSNSGFPWIYYDMWVDFEQCTIGAVMNATELAESTHGAAGTWDVSNNAAGLLTTQSAGEDQGHAATGDTGNRGMAYDVSTGTEDYIEWNLPAAQSSLSFGLWYKTGVPGTYTEGPHFVTLYNFGYGTMERLSDERSSADNTRQIRVSPLDVAVPVSDNTWYWVTVKFVLGGTGSFSVYDTSLSLVGSVNYTDYTFSPTQAILLGNTSGVSGQSGEVTYYDDLIVDYTHANFPLLPKIPVTVNISLTPTTVTGGNPVTGTVTLITPAPAGGATVTLLSSNPAVATVPPNVLVPEGTTTATFTVTTGGVTFNTSVAISATYNDPPQSANLTVAPVTMSQIADDSFNRSNSSTLGSNWTPLIGLSTNVALQVASDQVESTALSPDVGKEMYYGGLTWYPDQYSEVQIVAASGNGYEGPAVRMTSNDTYYACAVFNTGSGNATVEIMLENAGTSSILATSTTSSVSVGDVIRCTVQGTVVTMTDRTTSATLLTATDAKIPSGYPGLVDSAGTGSVTSYIMTNWAAGSSGAPLTVQPIASDNFNRADALNLGPDWHVGFGHGPVQIVSQQIQPYPAGGTQPSKEHYVAAGLFPNDQWSEIQVVVEDVLGDNAVEVRASDSSDTLYVLDVNITGAPGTAETRIASVLNGTITPLVVDTTWSAVSPFDYIRGQVQGSLLSLIDITTGTLLLSAFDTNITSGYAGISMQVLNGTTTDHIAANWSGGTFQ